MKIEDYFKKHGASLSSFLTSEAGRELFDVLHDIRPKLQPQPVEHMMVWDSGVIRGYEQCIRNIKFILETKPVQVTAVAHYNVPEPAEPPPFVPDSQKLKEPQPITK